MTSDDIMYEDWVKVKGRRCLIDYISGFGSFKWITFFFSFSASLYARSLHILLVKHKIKQKQKKSQHPSVENQKQFVAFNYDGKYLAYKFYVCDNFQMYKFPLRLGCKYFPFNSSLLIVALLWLVHLRNNNKKKDFFILFSGWYVP